MGEGGGDETAVAPRCTFGNALSFEEHHGPVRESTACLICRPQAAEAAAHHDEIGLDVTGERGPRRRTIRAIEPVGAMHDVRQGGTRWCRDSVGEGHVD